MKGRGEVACCLCRCSTRTRGEGGGLGRDGQHGRAPGTHGVLEDMVSHQGMGEGWSGWTAHAQVAVQTLKGKEERDGSMSMPSNDVSHVFLVD